MNLNKKVLQLFTIVFLFAYYNHFAQEKFTVGAFIASGPGKSIHYNNYQQVSDLGVNAVYQLAIKPFSQGSILQESNLEQLSQFPMVWAANDSGTGSHHDSIDAEWYNIDWISYFTSAKYMKWEAEGDPLFTDSVKIGHDFGTSYTDENISGWTSGSPNTENTNSLLINGPNYWQYPRYTFTNPSWNPEVIKYLASFRMKIDSPSQDTLPVCEIIITNTDSAGVDSILADSIITTSDLVTGYRNIIIPYDYRKYFHSESSTQNRYQFPGSFINQTDGYTYNSGSKVQFKIKWLGNKQLFVDYIEVYDQMIWDRWFNEPFLSMVDSIVVYDQEFAENSNFYSKLKYYYTMDEPHSIDGYTPLRKVQEILDNNNIQADLLTHWYSEGDNLRDEDPSWPPYIALAQPQKVMFWFAPFTNSTDTGIPWDRSHTLYLAHKMMQNAFYADSNFYVSAQTFGSKLGNTYIQWMLPDTSEISAETMLSLAHGSKGIFYEGYYTYGAITERHAEGLVDYPIGDYYPPRDIWYKVKDLTSRLNSELGDNLMKLNYTGEFLMLRQDVWESGFSGEFYDDYLTLSSENETCNYHTGFFTKDGLYDNDYYYFLLTNQLTTNPTNVNVTVKPKTINSGFTNFRFRNIEPAYNFDITFKDSTTKTLNNFPAGEGYLFQVAPVVKYGGKLLYYETTTNGITLYDKMSIESGATLTVNGTYTANADITVKAGGKLKYGSDNSKIIFSNGAKLILEGNAQVYGTSSTNKLSLQYDASTSIGVVVNPGASPVISYCNITGPSNGISVENEATINVSNTSISNCSNTGIALFHFGNGESVSTLSTPNIYKCSISNCGTAISAVNCSEVIIKENTITQCNLGLYFNMVNSAYISSNTILGWQSATGSPMPGISMSSSGGYLRNNTIRYHNFGVLLAYSSPDLGMNTIENNYKCGVYSSLGSYPNLVQQLANPECWYPIGGCNVIKDNGQFTEFRLPVLQYCLMVQKYF